MSLLLSLLSVPSGRSTKSFESVNTFAELPITEISVGTVYQVLTTTGIIGFRNKAGFYRWNGSIWVAADKEQAELVLYDNTNSTLTSSNQKAVNDELDTKVNSKEPSFTKNTAFNKNFGSTSGTVAEGNDARIIDSFQKSSDTLDDITAGATNKHFTATDEAKLDGIESGATADQTAGEIKTAYESNTNTNAFTNSEKTKLDGIENNATRDQTNAEIKTAYENNANTNAFTDADESKLDGIENNATADQTAEEIKTAYENNANTNAFTDADESKLDGIEAGATADQTKADIDALGINADTVDGLQASQFLRSDVNDTFTGGQLGFGSTTRQMIALYGPTGQYGIGVQSSTMYCRSDAGYAWYIGGSHSGHQNNPGPGGFVSMTLDGNSNLTVVGNVTINGSVSKGSGSFDIPHPNPAKKETHRLRHYFVETPSAGGNIYKYQFECEEGKNYFDLPDYYKFLNKDSLVWCNPFKHFGRAWGEVVENKKIKVITDSKGIYNTLIFADRKDKIAMEEFNKYGIEYKLNK